MDLFIDGEDDGTVHDLTCEYALSKLNQYYGVDEEGDLFISLFGYYYDEESDEYWVNQELYNKHKRYQAMQHEDEKD